MNDNLFYLMVAGSRDFQNYAILEKLLDYIVAQIPRPIVIVQGEARGADSLAKRYAQSHSISSLEFPADWKSHGKRAGYLRNKEMVDFIKQFPHRGIVCFWDDSSRGTYQNFGLAEEARIDLIIVHYLTNNIELRKEGRI